MPCNEFCNLTCHAVYYIGDVLICAHVLYNSSVLSRTYSAELAWSWIKLAFKAVILMQHNARINFFLFYCVIQNSFFTVLVITYLQSTVAPKVICNQSWFQNWKNDRPHFWLRESLNYCCLVLLEHLLLVTLRTWYCI